MALVQALIAWLSNSAGKILNSAFSWATLLMFGRVPSNRRTILSIICLLSVVWFFCFIGILFPRFSTFMITFVAVPSWVETAWIRLAMTGSFLLIPIANGFLSAYLDEPATRPSIAKWKLEVKNGWRLTLALALTLVLMLLIAPINKAGELIKRWKADHIPIITEPKDYAAVVAELKGILEAAGIRTEEKKPHIIMQAPIWMLVTFAGPSLKNLVAEKLTKLTFDGGELEIHPSDLVIRGTLQKVNRVLSLVISHYTFGLAYLTWTKEANQLEIQLRKLWMTVKDNRIPRYTALKRADLLFKKLEKLNLNMDEFETVYRALLKLKLDILQGIHEIEKKAI